MTRSMSAKTKSSTSLLPRTILGRATLVLALIVALVATPTYFICKHQQSQRDAAFSRANEIFLAVALRAYLSGAQTNETATWLEQIAADESRVVWGGAFDAKDEGFELRRNDAFAREQILGQLKTLQSGSVFQPVVLNKAPSKRYMLAAARLNDNAGVIAAVVDVGAVPTFTSSAAIASVAGCAFVVWLVGIMLMNGMVCAPLRRACKGANAVEEDLQRLSNTDFAPPELGAMAKSLLSLKKELQHYRSEASELRHSLDRRVEARTRDVERAAKRAARDADTDALTKLSNRRALENELPDIVRKHKKARAELCAMWVDLDNFKKLNDTLGHQAGDELLEFAGELLRATIRRESDRAYRYGGDEFVLLLSGLRPIEAKHVAERVLAMFSQRVKTMPATDHPCGMSIGIALLQEHSAANGEKLLKLADLAMYIAKDRKNAIALADEIPAETLADLAAD